MTEPALQTIDDRQPPEGGDISPSFSDGEIHRLGDRIAALTLAEAAELADYLVEKGQHL
jgi:hypothetical protein